MTAEDAELRDAITAVVRSLVSYDQEAAGVDEIMRLVEQHHHCASCDMHACGDLDRPMPDLSAVHQALARRESNEPERRLVVNPEPLKVVEARPGGSSPEREFILCRCYRGERLVAASIHWELCKVAPKDGQERRDGGHWAVKRIPRHEIAQAVDEADDEGVETSVSCRSCRGWSVA